ncbi:MAG TPA: hypothetical protein VJ818_06680 [Actinomycetota bacterium]|nr:hypothetical protein [Actinomycetota bacterium]
MGTAAGALTGLMFVVIALRREQTTNAPVHAMRSFATPTIVHFTSVVVLAALLTMPRLRTVGIGWVLVLFGSAGLLYMGFVIMTARRRVDFASDLEDTVFHFTLPPVAHAALVAAGVLIWSHHPWSMYIVAGSMLVLLVVGIHNAWDSAVWFVRH